MGAEAATSRALSQWVRDGGYKGAGNNSGHINNLLMCDCIFTCVRTGTRRT